MSAAAGRRTLDSQLQAGLQRLSSRIIYPGRSLTYPALRSGVLQQQLPWVQVVCQLVTLDDRLSCSTLARDEEVVRALAQFAWAHAPYVFPVDSNQGQAHASSGSDSPQVSAPSAAAPAPAPAAEPPGCTAGAAADPAAAPSARSNVAATAATAAAAAAGSNEVPVGGVRRTRSSARQAPATLAAAEAAPSAPSGRAAKRRAVATSTTAAAAAPPAAAAAGGVDQQQPFSGEALHAALLAGRREWQEASLEALSYDPAATILINQACAAGLHALVGLLGVSCCGCVLQQAVPYVLLRGLVLLAKNFAPSLFLQMMRYLTALSSSGLLQDQALWCQLLSEAAAGQAHSATALRLVWGKAGGAALLLAGPAAVPQAGRSSSSGGAGGGADGAGPSSSRSSGASVAHGGGSGSSSARPSSSGSGSSCQSRFAVELTRFFERSGGSVTSAAVAKALVAATPELFRWHSGQHPAARGLVKALCSGAVYAAAAGDHKVCELLAAALTEILEAAPVPAAAAAPAAGGGLGGPPAAAAAAAAAGGGAAGAAFPELDAGYVAAALAAAEAHQAAATEALVAAGAALAGPAVAAAAAGAAAGQGAAGAVAEADAMDAVAAMNVVHDSMVQAQADAEAAILALQAAQAAIAAAGLLPAEPGQQEEAVGAGAAAEDPATTAVLTATANLQAASAAVQAAIGPVPAAELMAAIQAATAAVAATAAATAHTVATLMAPAVPPLPAAAAAAPPAPAPAPAAAAAAAAAGLLAAGQAAMEAVAAASARGSSSSSSSSSSPVPGALVELLLALLRQQDSLARAGVWTVLHRVVQAQHWGLLVGHLLGAPQGSSSGGQLQQLLDGLAASFESVGGYSYVQVSTLQRLLLQDLGVGQAAVQHPGLMSAAMQQLGSSPWLWYGAAPGIVQLMTQGAGPAAVASCPRVLTQLLNQQVLNDGQVQEVWEGLLGNETFIAGLLAGVAAAEEAWLRLLWREDLVEVTNVATAHPGLPQALAEACGVVMGPLESLDDLLMFLMTSDPGQAYLDAHPVLLAAVAARLGKGGCYALPVWYMGNLWFNDEGPVWLLRHPVLLEAVARALVNNQGHWDSEAVAMELSTRAAFQEVVLGSAEIFDQLIKVLGSKARGTLSVTQQLVQPCVTILQGLAAAEATLILEQRSAAAEAGGAAAAEAAGGGGAVGGAAAAAAAAAEAAAHVMAAFALGPPPAAEAAAGGEEAAQQVMAAAMAADAAMAGIPPQLAAAAAFAPAAMAGAAVAGGWGVGDPLPPPPPPPAAAAGAGGAAAVPAAVPQQALRPPVVELVLQRAASEDPDIQAGVWEAMSVLHRVLLANIRLQLLTPLQRFAAAGQEVQQCQASLGALQASKRAVELEREHTELDTAIAQLATSRMLMQQEQQQQQEHGQGGAGGVASSSRGAAGGNSQGGLQHAGQQQLEGQPREDQALAGANSSAAAALAAAGPSSRQRKRRMEVLGAATVEEEEPSKRTRGQRRR